MCSSLTHTHARTISFIHTQCLSLSLSHKSQPHTLSVCLFVCLSVCLSLTLRHTHAHSAHTHTHSLSPPPPPPPPRTKMTKMHISSPKSSGRHEEAVGGQLQLHGDGGEVAAPHLPERPHPQLQSAENQHRSQLPCLRRLWHALPRRGLLRLSCRHCAPECGLHW